MLDPKLVVYACGCIVYLCLLLLPVVLGVQDSALVPHTAPHALWWTLGIAAIVGVGVSVTSSKHGQHERED